MNDLTESKEELLIQKKEAELREAKRRKNHNKRAFETRMKCVIGGTFHKYFPQAYLFDQNEWSMVINRVVRSQDFKDAIKEIIGKNPELWNKICSIEEEKRKKEEKKNARKNRAGGSYTSHYGACGSYPFCVLCVMKHPKKQDAHPTKPCRPDRHILKEIYADATQDGQHTHEHNRQGSKLQGRQVGGRAVGIHKQDYHIQRHTDT